MEDGLLLLSLFLLLLLFHSVPPTSVLVKGHQNFNYFVVHTADMCCKQLISAFDLAGRQNI